MKKIFAMLIACGMLISLASCSSDSKDTTADAGTTASTETDARNTNGTATDNGTTTDSGANTDVQTDAPVTEKLKTLYKWTFDDEEVLDTWTPSDNIVSCEIENDVLNITLSESDIDPYYMSELIEDDVFTEDIKTITLRVKNCTSVDQGAIYYCTESMQFYEGESFIKFTYQNSGENADWEIVTLNITEIADTLPNWDGCFTRLRLDCINNASDGNFYVDYISING